MMKGFFLIILAITAGFLGTYFSSSKNSDTRTQVETAFSRVERTRTLRCGYYYRAGYYEKDQKTGQMKGLYVDYMAALADYLGLKVEWAYEIGLGDIPEALKIGKIDAFCSGLAENAKRSWHIAFAEPMAYLQLFVYVKKDNTRFDMDLKLLNDPSVKFYTVDGESTYFITKADFPNATIISMPQMTEHSDLLLGLAGGKVDALLSDRVAGERFMQHNPNKIRPLSGPHRRLPLSIGVANTEPLLLNMLSAATRELVLSGKLEKIIQDNEEFPNTYGRNALAQ